MSGVGTRIEYPRHARELVFYLPIKKLKFLYDHADNKIKKEE
jgi:hypothetical protein